MNLESFKFAALEAGLQLVLVPGTHLRATIGAGEERRLLFSSQPRTGAALVGGLQYSLAQSRLYAESRLELTFDPESLRRDHHHRLDVSARMYGPPRSGDAGAVHFSGMYRKMWRRGWDEFWLEARGVSRTGYVVFPEEQSIGDGDLLRGPFGAVYARRVGGLNLEYRFSLLRDIFKLGLFHNAAVYGDIIKRSPFTEKLAFADHRRIPARRVLRRGVVDGGPVRQGRRPRHPPGILTLPLA